MINTSKYFRDSVRLAGRENIDAYVIIGGTKVEKHNIKSMTFNYELGNDGMPSIGNAPSQTLDITLYRRDNVPNYLRLDQTVVPYIGFYIFNGSRWYYEYVKMGTFYIPNADNVDKNDLEISMTCFDNMARMSDENRKRVQIDYNKPEVPTGTISTVCRYLASKAGISFDYSSIEEDVAVKVSPAGWNIRQVLQELAFLQGKNVIVDRENRFKFVKPKEVDFNDFNIKAKNALSINYKSDLYSTMAALKCEQLNYTRINDEVDANEHTYEIVEGNMETYDPDDYTEEDSPLVDTNVTGVMFHTSTVTSYEDLEAVYNRCMPYTYYNYELETQGFPQVEVGDIITFVNKEGVERKLLVSSHKCVYDGGCKSTFSATGKDSEYTNVEDIEWWDLKDRDPDEDKNKEEKFTEHYFNTGTNYYSKDNVDFEGNYMSVDTTITTKITDENENVTYKYETDYDEIVAPNLVKLDTENHKIHVGKLALGDNNRWYLTEVETMNVGEGGGGGGCNCNLQSIYDRLDQLERRIKFIEDNCDCGGVKPVYYTLTIKYIYANGTEAAKTYTNSYLDGASYSVKSPTIDHYKPDKDTVSGKISSDTTVTVTYTEAPKYLLKINYVYASGGQASSPYEQYYYEGESYSVSSPTINGFTPDKATVSGTIYSTTTVDVIYSMEVPTNNLYGVVACETSDINNAKNIPLAIGSIQAARFYNETSGNINANNCTNAVLSNIGFINMSISTTSTSIYIWSPTGTIKRLDVKYSNIGSNNWVITGNDPSQSSGVRSDEYYDLNYFIGNPNYVNSKIPSINTYGSSIARGGNTFVQLDTTSNSGKVTLKTYELDSNYNLILRNTYALPTSIVSLVSPNKTFSQKAKAYASTNVSVNYNANIASVASQVIPTFASLGYKGNFRPNAPVFSSLIAHADDTTYPGQLMIGFGKLTGVTNNGGTAYINYNVQKALLFSSGCTYTFN